MKIIVCLNFLKYIPGENGHLVEDKNVNPSCLDNETKAVVEQALELKKQSGGTVIVAAQGKHRHQVLLRETLAMGCDAAWMIQRESVDLHEKPNVSMDMEKLIKLAGYDLIITGYRMKSGISTFLGAEIAQLLSVNQISCGSKLRIKKDHILTAEISCDNDLLQAESSLPCVVTLANSMAENKTLSVSEISQSFKKELIVWKDRELDELRSGDENKRDFSSGSFTIDDFHQPEKRKECVLYDEISVGKAVNIIIENLCRQNIIKEAAYE